MTADERPDKVGPPGPTPPDPTIRKGPPPAAPPPPGKHVPQVVVGNIPADLRQPRQWVAWRKTKPDPKTGKIGKQPINPHTGRLASHSDPHTWGTFDEALHRARRDGLAGVGFVFTDDDEFVGIDLDRVLDSETGEINRTWADRVLELLGDGPHFVEKSVSGLGLKVIVRGDLPVSGKRRDNIEDDSGIEVYRTTRFFALTTNLFDGYPPVAICGQVPAGALEMIISEFAGYRPNGTTAPHSNRGACTQDGEERRPRWYGPDEAIPEGITADELVLDGIERDKRFESQLAFVWEKKKLLRPGSDDSQSGWDLRLARLLLHLGIPDCFVEDLLHKYRTQHCADTNYPDKALRADYLLATLAAAKEIIAKPSRHAAAQFEVGALDGIATKGKRRKRRKKGPQEATAGKQKAPAPNDGRLEVPIYPSAMPHSIDIAEEALGLHETAKGPKRRLYTRGGTLVQLIKSPDGDARSMQVKVGAIREHMGRAAQFLKFDDDPEERPTLVDFPKDYAVAYLDRGEWPFPPLKGISRVPLLLNSGRLITTPGYDAEAQVYVDIVEGEWREVVPDDPSEDDARAALALLLDAIREFPFVNETHRSAALAGMLTGVARYMFEFAPMTVISAPSRSAGKSELAELLAIMATGERARGYQFRNDTTEMDKLFHSIFLESVACVHLENVEVELRGAPLCTAISQARYARRILGVSATSAPATTGTTWLASGINVVVAADMVRRVLRCELDPRMERPEERRFERKHFSVWVQEHRRELVGAALTILAAYCRAERPPQQYSPWAGFEGWNATVRSPLLWLGEADPCAERRGLDEEDPEREDLALMLGVLYEAFADQAFTSNDVAVRWGAGDEIGNNLQVACSAVLSEATSRALGNYLGRRKDRIVNGLRCRKVATPGGLARWRIERVGDGPAEGLDVGAAGVEASLWDS